MKETKRTIGKEKFALISFTSFLYLVTQFH